MNKQKIKIGAVAIGLALLTGCTSAPLQLSADTYMISKTSGAGMFASQAGMQAKAIKAANKFAASKGKIAVARGSSWERPNPGLPTFTYQFILVDKDDPRDKDVSLQPVADVTVEVAK